MSSGGDSNEGTDECSPDPFEVFQAAQSNDMRFVPPSNPGFSAASTSTGSLYPSCGDGHKLYDVRALTQLDFSEFERGVDNSDSDGDVFESDFCYGDW